ncbi:MAG: GNAT family N-acetyltransferase [Vibrio gallaecicus]|uniref:N-acetyltransferase family protein n=1 Tax=Vibrio gallaecicus TaxID=552386 RepID=A0ABV4N9V4_9VIBR|nr:GNAT family N-acetyltransferase [Vibrio gallaecicus]MDN3615978.1 GNAT family N-acetyltransferase [Vibrio gallaecicus]
MQIRIAKVADIRSILELSDQINRQHHAGAPMVFASPSMCLVDSEEYWLSLMIDRQGVFYVAVSDNQVVGFVVGKVSQNRGVSFIQPHKIGRVNTIVVRDTIQNKGVGKALMLKFKEWAQSEGAIEMRLEVMEFNQQAQAFYESLGLETQSRTMSMNLEA